MAELTEAVHALGATIGPPQKDELDRSSRVPYQSSHTKLKTGKNDLTILGENSLSGMMQRSGPRNVTSKRIDPKDENWEKKLKKIMKRK